MQAARSLVEDVEAAVAGSDPERRVRLLRAMTDLFVGQAERLGAEQVGLFDNVIGVLAQEIDRTARLELAERLAHSANAPRRTIRMLALDHDPEIAGPVLAASPLVALEDLATVVAERGVDHLLAVARRPDLEPSLAAEILRRGDHRAHAALLHRGPRPGEDKEKPNRRTRRTTSTTAVRDAAVRLRGAAAAGGPTEDEIEEMVTDGRIAEALAALAIRSGLPASVVAQAYAAPQPEPLMFIVRAEGLGWSVLSGLLDARGAEKGAAPDLDELKESFELLTESTAGRVMRFVSVRAATERPPAALSA